MRSRARGLPRLINLISLGIILAGCLFVLLRRGNFEEGEAIAAPARKPAATEAATDGGVLAAASAKGASDIAPPHEPADAGTASGEVEPIDLAIAPDGGVPYHPDGARFRSPFAKPNPGPTVRVTVGMLLNSVDDYDVKTGTFLADFFLSLTSAQPMPSLNLQFPNGKIENKEVIADKPTFKLYRFLGAFKSPPDLRRYPFDSQGLKIIVEDDSRGIDQVRFTADKERTQLARGFRALGWQVSFVEARSLSQSYPDRFEGDDLYYGRYIFTLGLERFATSAAFKVFVPAFVIVIIALLGMWVPPGEMEVRSNAGAPMLAGAVLFHYSLIQELPATSYLTRADKLMLAVYISLALGMVSTWWMFLVKEENMDVVFRVARIAVPILTVVVMAFGCLA
ncbi:MAG: hypothetical protein ABW133_24680 [Polyangiaceae bacterium]